MSLVDVESECHMIKTYNEERAEEFFDYINNLNFDNIKLNDDVDLSDVLRYIEKSQDELSNKMNQIQSINK